MLGYVTIGALDSEASGRFYDAVLGALDCERKSEGGGWIGYGTKASGPGMENCHTALCPPHDGQLARPGNGIMVAYQAQSPAHVVAAYEAGIEAGGSDEGKPGFRPPEASSGFYAAYLRDPTGNKISLYVVVSAA